MSSEHFEKLLEVVSDSDKKELALAHNSKIGAMKACQERFSKSAKDDYDAARAMLEETIERLWLRYFPEDQPAAAAERFKNRKQAFGWLKSQGYKVSTGKFYGDCEAGFPAIYKDGSVSRYQVLQYGQQLDVERRSSAPAPGSIDKDAWEARKTKADAEKAEMQTETLRRELDERWIMREESEDREAIQVGLIKDCFRHRVYLDSQQLMHALGVTPQKESEFTHHLQMFVNSAFNDFSRISSIDLEFEEDDDL